MCGLWWRRTLWTVVLPSNVGSSTKRRRGHRRRGIGVMRPLAFGAGGHCGRWRGHRAPECPIGVTRPLASAQGNTVGDAVAIECRYIWVRPCVIFGGYDVRAQGGYRGVCVVIVGWGLGGGQQTTCGLRRMMSCGTRQSVALDGNITIEQIHELFCYSDKCVIFQ